ncbi:leucine-rich repeat domain-containing protein [Spirosoma aerolatum]|uniref:leucine-rich repeat domain-containing protein n=1 Tax=Spirosoma aerolatum TaxID=1211326 RepID=UPI0009AEE447|nr:leucine-rich repeat domain-containing protein [Spirosoma aerolatum]
MLKGLLFVYLMLTGLVGYAQSPVVFLRDTTRLGVSLASLERSFPPPYDKLIVQAGKSSQLKGAFSGRTKLYFDSLNAQHQQFFTFIERNKKRLPALGLLFQTQEFIRADGSYEWVFCQVDGQSLTSEQESKLLALLTEWYTQHPFPIKTENGFRRSTMTTLGQPPQKRTVRRGPGIISTVEAAEKTLRPDTVTMLAFNHLELSSVPEVVYRFPKLEELDLSRNNLHELPARLTADIPTLKRLSVLFNVIPNDSVFITRNKHIRSLNIQGNKLTKIPESIRQNRRLESLWLGYNKLTTITDADVKTLRRMRKLSDLNLYSVGLSQLPTSIGRLKRVKVLDLYYNKFIELPPQIGKMKRLEQLAVAHNELRNLPVTLTKLRHLQVLYAHHNHLSQLPDEFSRLHSLRILDLSYNWYVSVPAVIGTLSSLQELSFNNNNLHEFPSMLLSLKGLKKVFLGSNPLFGQEAMKSPYAPQIKQLEANNTDVSY